MTRSTLDQRTGLVFYPDGSSCFVPLPYRNGSRIPSRQPCNLVEPWTRRKALPPVDCSWATLEDLQHISLALMSASSAVLYGAAAAWRDEHLSMEACRDPSCRHRNDCVLFRPPGQPRSEAELARLGIRWSLAGGFWEPFHVRLGNKASWAGFDGGRPWRRAADAVLCAAFPDADVPPSRTRFTPVAVSAGLPLSLQYVQEGDVVLYQGAPHFVCGLNGLGGGELLLQRDTSATWARLWASQRRARRRSDADGGEAPRGGARRRRCVGESRCRCSKGRRCR